MGARREHDTTLDGLVLAEDAAELRRFASTKVKAVGAFFGPIFADEVLGKRHGLTVSREASGTGCPTGGVLAASTNLLTALTRFFLFQTSTV